MPAAPSGDLLYLEQRKKAQAYAYPHCGAISEEKLRPTLTGKLFREINFNKLMPNQLVVKFLNFFSKSQTETLFHFHSVISCWTIPRALRQEAVLKQHPQHKRTACTELNNYQHSEKYKFLTHFCVLMEKWFQEDRKSVIFVKQDNLIT